MAVLRIKSLACCNLLASGSAPSILMSMTTGMTYRSETTRYNPGYMKKCGWTVIRVWECQILRTPQKCVNKILKSISSRQQIFHTDNSRDILLSQSRDISHQSQEALPP